MNTFGELDHPARLLMGPGPINVHPRVLRAMSVQLAGPVRSRSSRAT